MNTQNKTITCSRIVTSKRCMRDFCCIKMPSHKIQFIRSASKATRDGVIRLG